MRQPYTKCEWKSRAELEQAAGTKRVTNYIKKVGVGTGGGRMTPEFSAEQALP